MKSSPAPWLLTGEGYILAFKFPAHFVQAHGFIPPFLKNCFAGGIGAVMLVDYQQSPVGPYREALFIPGHFNYAKRRLLSITKIYVSTLASVEDGQRNWGIPKELATFEFDNLSSSEQHIKMSNDERTILDITISSHGPSIPVNTAWNPISFTLIQQQGNRIMLTKPQGRGKIQHASIECAVVEENAFPDFTRIKPLGVIRILDFSLHFPVPRLLSASQVLANESGS